LSKRPFLQRIWNASREIFLVWVIFGTLIFLLGVLLHFDSSSPPDVAARKASILTIALWVYGISGTILLLLRTSFLLRGAVAWLSDRRANTLEQRRVSGIIKQIAFAWELSHRLYVVPGSIRHGGGLTTRKTWWKEAVAKSTKTLAFFPGEMKSDSVQCSTCGEKVAINGTHFDFRRTILEALKYSAAIVFLPFSPVGLGVIWLTMAAGDNDVSLLPSILISQGTKGCPSQQH